MTSVGFTVISDVFVINLVMINHSVSLFAMLYFVVLLLLW